VTLAATDEPTKHTDICDYTRCPRCDAEARGTGYATLYFNAGGILWAVCERHSVRWYVTREMLGFHEERDEPGSLWELPEVKCLIHLSR
jgi:hypothetical protein